MNEIIYEAIRAVLVISIMVVVRYAVPYLKSLINGTELEWIYAWAVKAVKAAEQTNTGDHTGSVKKAIVKEFLVNVAKEKNLSITDEQLENLIESAVYAMKQEDAKNEGSRVVSD